MKNISNKAYRSLYYSTYHKWGLLEEFYEVLYEM